MKCGNCGTEIAAKALICFRCGEATTAPKFAPPPPRAERGPIPVIIAILVIIAAAVLGLPELPEGTPRLAGWASVVIATVVAVLTLRPVKRRGLR